MQNVCHRTQQSCECLKDKKGNFKLLTLLPGTVLILHGSLLNHMTIIIEVRASCIDHMNDDMLEVNRFTHECYRLCPPPVLRKESGTRLETKHMLTSKNQAAIALFHFQASLLCGRS